MFNIVEKMRKSKPVHVVNIPVANIVTADGKPMAILGTVIWVTEFPEIEVSIDLIVDAVVRNAFSHVAENMSFGEINENPKLFLSTAIEWANLDRRLCGMKLMVVIGNKK